MQSTMEISNHRHKPIFFKIFYFGYKIARSLQTGQSISVRDVNVLRKTPKKQNNIKLRSK